jgi:pimeloyl-ACP methyl ester carboxylesterase
MSEVVSKDGTRIAYERLGSGPPVVLIDGALCSREFGPMPQIASLLTPNFTVYLYDRRGRGASGDTQPYSKAREVEDVQALIAAAGGSAFVFGTSSGAGLALEAAASGANIAKLAVYEPPFIGSGPANHEQRLKSFVAAGQRAAALKYFMRDMVGAPAFMVFILPLMRGMWRKLKAVAHTLPYDAAIMGNWEVPAGRLVGMNVPTLAMHGGKTPARLRSAVEALVRVLPNVRHRELPGQTHNVSPAVLVPVLREFFTENAR